MTDYQGPVQRLRLTFSKGEEVKYVGHLDLHNAWERAFRRARLPLAHSQGYNPRPRFQIAAALPVGVTGQAELLDVWLDERLEPGDVLRRLQPLLPPGFGVSAVEEVDLRAPALQSQMRAATYRVVVDTRETVDGLRGRVRSLLDTPTLPRQRQQKGKLRTYDLRPLIHDITVTPGRDGQCVLDLYLAASPEGAGRPDEVLDVLGLSHTPHRIERTGLVFAGAEFDK